MEEKLLSEKAKETMFSDYPEIVTVKEISEMLGLHKNKVYDLIKEGMLPKIPCCRHIKVAKISVIKYVLQSAQ